MPTSLDDLISPRTKETILNSLLLGLQGISPVRKTGTGIGDVSADGVAAGDYSVRLKISTAGAIGVGAFQVSLDGGITYAAAETLPPSGEYVVGTTGVTVTFSDGVGIGTPFELGDIYALELTTPSFPTASYVPGSTPLTILEKDAVALEDLDQTITAIARGGYTSLAKGQWLDLILEQFYNLARSPGASTVGNVVLTDAASSGPHTIVAGSFWVGTISGLRYVAMTGGTLPNGDALTISVKAESVGSKYNTGANVINQLVTSLPGVVVNNPNPLGGSWITTPGSDRESDIAGAKRAQARWPELSTGATEQVYETWAFTASNGAATRVYPRPSPTVEGQIDVFLASSTGTVSGAIVTAVQNYIDPRVPLPAVAVVLSAVAHAVTVTATVYVQAGYSTQALAAAQLNVAALFNGGTNSVGEGLPGIDIGRTVYLNQIVEQLQLPTGVRNVVIASPAADVVLAATEVAVLTLNLTPVEI